MMKLQIILFAVAVLLHTVLAQQSMDTCDGLDMLIGNGFITVVGNCSRNDDCNQVTCMGGIATITLTFPTAPTSPCSIRNQVSLASIDFDETVTESQELSVGDSTINLIVNFSPAGNATTVSYGVSATAPVPLAVFNQTDIPIKCVDAGSRMQAMMATMLCALLLTKLF